MSVVVMNRNILDETCTLFKKGAEEYRTVNWTREVFPCHWEQRTGSYRTPDGEDSAYSLEMICTHPGIAKGDKLVRGIESASKPPQGAYTVVYVDALPLHGKTHHYEVYAK